MYKKIVLFLSFLLVLIPIQTNARNFLRTLRVGDFGEDVRFIQKTLNLSPQTQVSQTGAGSPGNESIFFGTATKQAIIRFQNLYADEILKPAGLTQGTGIAGFYTLKKINEIADANAGKNSSTNTATSTKTQKTNQNITGAPFIESISPKIFDSSQMVQITGRNFDQTDNTVLFSLEDPNRFTHISSNSSTNIQLPINVTLSNYIASAKNPISTLTGDTRAAVIAHLIQTGVVVAGPGDGSAYINATIAIKTKNGTSNSMPVLVKVINK